MTFKELMFNQTGYECFTTFFEDFTIAEKFGIDAVKDTYNRAFKEWKSNYKYLTELVMILNWKIWQHYEKNDELATLYNSYGKKQMLMLVNILRVKNCPTFIERQTKILYKKEETKEVKSSKKENIPTGVESYFLTYVGLALVSGAGVYKLTKE